MSNCFDFFDQIYCINLKHRTDRWENCLRQFSRLGISDRVIRKEGLMCAHPKLSQKQNAQIGCALSHYSILKEAQEKKYSNILVFEDDFLFFDNYNTLSDKINKSTKELPENWDLFYLGGFFVKGYSYEPVEPYSENLIRANTCFCAHSLAYSRNAINKILNNLKLESEKDVLNFSSEYEAIDWYYVREIQNNSQSFACSNLLCVQKEGYSDIEKRYFDYKEKFKSSYSQYVKK